MNYLFQRRRRFLGATWSPAAIFAASELGVWFAPSDISTLFQDSAGTTPVTAAGQPVGLMLDKSGNDKHASQATAGSRPTYQIDAGGRPYLAFDGVDDFMVTPTITPGTDKVQVFAGVRKLSDAATGVVVGLGVSGGAGAQNGATELFAPAGVADNFSFQSRGTLPASGTATGYAAPTSNILTGLGDISGDLATLRIDGAQVAQSTSDQGTGNYLAYPLYIGRRGGTSSPANMDLYQLANRFGANLDAPTIARAEAFFAAKTGVTL